MLVYVSTFSFFQRFPPSPYPLFFFFNDTATTEIYTLSLHDALPISPTRRAPPPGAAAVRDHCANGPRSEEHTSELQSLAYLVCRLLLEKKKKNSSSQGRRHHLASTRHPLTTPPSMRRMSVTGLPGIT